MNSIRKLLYIFRINVHIFLIVWVLSFILLALVSYAIPEKYQAKMILVTSEDSRNQFQSMGSAGALASLAGVSIESDASRSQKALTKIVSKSFFKDMISNHGDYLLPALVAPKNYEKESGILRFNEKKYANGVWYGKKDFDLSDKIFVEEAFENYLKSLRVNENRMSKIITITYDHISPEFSYEILEIILEQINKSQRDADQTEAEFVIDFINNSLDNYSNEQLKGSAINLLERQLVKLMITKSKKYYLLEPIDGPHIPAKRSFPSRSLIVLLGETLISLILFLWLFFRNDQVNIDTFTKSNTF
jgi:uncharacterized protein involved in exopolysaccharide biosynthesis